MTVSLLKKKGGGGGSNMQNLDTETDTYSIIMGQRLLAVGELCCPGRRVLLL